MNQLKNLLLSLCLLCPLAHAQYIFNNVGTGNTFDPASGTGVGYLPGTYLTAGKFTAGETSFITGADLALWGTNDLALTVRLYADHPVTSRSLPGTILETSAVTFTRTTNWSASPLTQITFSGTTLLSAGTAYWIALVPSTVPSSDLSIGWETRSYPSSDVAWTNPSMGSNWMLTGEVQAYMRVYGTPAQAPTVSPVPEPSTYALCGSLALVTIGTLRHRRRKASVVQ